MSLCLTLPFPCPLLGVNGNNLLDSESESVSHSVLSDPLWSLWTEASQSSLSMEFSRQLYWSRLSFPSPGDLPDPGIEPGSPALQTDSLPSEPSGTPKCESESCSVVSDSLWSMDYTVHRILQARILEWVAFPFSRGSFQPRDQIQVSHIACGFFTSWATREALDSTIHQRLSITCLINCPFYEFTKIHENLDSSVTFLIAIDFSLSCAGCQGSFHKSSWQCPSFGKHVNL